jgi:EAL domain-containing protein (putative c-di-GMP-specific phosphodiesterase class I)
MKKARAGSAGNPKGSPARSRELWQTIIDERTWRYRRSFISITLLLGLLFPLVIGFVSIRDRDYANLVPLSATTIVLLGAFMAIRALGRTGFDRVVAFLLFLFPPLYVWGCYAEGNYGSYLFVFFCLPPIFDSLASNRRYWAWEGYALFHILVPLFSVNFGFPSHWNRDFPARTVVILHASLFVLWAMRSVSRRQMFRNVAELADAVLKDRHTGLPSLVAFKDHLEKEGRSFVALITIANFHELSILFGYTVSSGVLAVAASRLREAATALNAEAFSLRGHDLGFARPCGPDDRAEELAERLAGFLRGPVEFQGKTVEIGYRIGFTVSQGGDAAKALDEAEQAAGRAERTGQETSSYSPGLDRPDEAAIAIADLMTLSRNVSESLLGVFYQPVVSLSDGGVAWNEALVRFRGRDEKYLEPARLMSLAATTGHWAAIEDFMLSRVGPRACARGEPVSLNVALTDLGRKEFRQAVVSCASEAKARGSALILEILESDFGVIDEGYRMLLDEVRTAGCLVAIDDFGTGYSNYARLFTLPPDIVKFDRSMISGSSGSGEADPAIPAPDEELVRGLVAYCRQRGILTVAEGIETEAQAGLAQSLGFDFGQGFFWSRPVPEDQVAAADPSHLSCGDPELPRRIPDAAPMHP